MPKIEPIAPIPYEIQSKYTKINPATHSIETHTYVSINGKMAVHKVEASMYTAYDKQGKEVANTPPGQNVDKLA